MATLTEAKKDDTGIISRFLSDMILEVGEFPPETALNVPQAVDSSFDENVYWFLFRDETGEPFGTCCCQPIFSYWSKRKRFYFGAFYISPSFRGKGYTESLYEQLKRWAEAHSGYSLFCFIHKNNDRSRKAFSKAGCHMFPDIDVFYDRFQDL